MQFSEIKGIGEKRIQVLHASNIRSLRDVLFCFPIKYKDTSNIKTIASLVEGEKVCIEGFVQGKVSNSYYNGINRTIANIADSSGSVKCIWFNAPWIRNVLINDKKFILYGTVYIKNNILYINNPSIEEYKGIIPVYKKIEKFPKNIFLELVSIALKKELSLIADFIPDDILLKFNLIGLKEAILKKHQPKSMLDVEKASERFMVDDLLKYIGSLQKFRNKSYLGIKVFSNEENADEYWKTLNFTPTNAQKKALFEILTDLKSDYPMARLLQGDVGSGKTAVAFGAALITIKAGYQCVFMAPTEVLAKQQYIYANEYFKKYNIKVGLLTGNLSKKERDEAYFSIKKGLWKFIFGTHALFSEGLEYNNVGLIITDEQHRFGVAQRKMLQNKAELEGVIPNVLIMSATPIPRSTALILLSDLDITTIDEMPKGRQSVSTLIVPEFKRDDMYEFIKTEIKKGKQAYIICSLVEENESEDDNDIKSAKTHYKQLKNGAFKGFKLGLLYGKQKNLEKDKVINDFHANKIQILVSTTVVEVGINVKNANIIVIENAERFGLAQLHQLRGRVGRDGSTAWCFIMSKPSKKLNLFCNITDGFELSKLDFQLRGPGEVLGLNQHGSSYFSSILMDKSVEYYVNLAKLILETIFNNPNYNVHKNLIEEEILILSESLEKNITFA